MSIHRAVENLPQSNLNKKQKAKIQMKFEYVVKKT